MVKALLIERSAKGRYCVAMDKHRGRELDMMALDKRRQPWCDARFLRSDQSSATTPTACLSLHVRVDLEGCTVSRPSP